MTEVQNAPKIEPADIEAEIVGEHYFTAAEGVYGSNEVPGGMDAWSVPESLKHVTFCVMILRNGTKIVGINHGPVSPENFDPVEGRRYARRHAIDQIWPLMGYAMRERIAASKTES